MNSRKRYVEVDRLSRIEEDLERLSLCEQPIQDSQQIHHHTSEQFSYEENQHDKLLGAHATGQHLFVKNEYGQNVFLQGEKLQEELEEQEMLMQLRALQLNYQDIIHDKHQENDIQQTNSEKQYCKLDCPGSEITPCGNHYQHLTDFTSGTQQNVKDSCNHTNTNSKHLGDDAENCDGGIKFLKEKYDSLGKLKISKPHVTSDQIMTQIQNQIHENSSPQPKECVDIHRICQHQPSMQFNQQSREFQMHDVQHFYQQDRIQEQWKQQFDGLCARTEGRPNNCNQQLPQQYSQQMKQEHQERRLLSDHDLMQVDIFYRSQRSDIFVSRCCASLMLGPKWSFQSIGSLGGSPASGVRQLCKNFRDWVCVKSGIPVLVLDTSKGELCLILAEHGSGFALWRNRMGPLTGYSVIAADFHALRTDPSMQRSLATSSSPSTLSTSIVGINFADSTSAEEFYKNVVKLSTLASSPNTAISINRNRHVSGDPAKDLAQRDQPLSNSTQDLQASIVSVDRNAGERSKSSKKNKKLSSKSFSKADISQPCCFTHVTKLGDRFRDSSSRLFVTASDTNVILRGTATIDKKSALHRLQAGLKQKH